MSKKLGIIAILVVLLMIGTIPFVMGADSTAVDPVLEPKIQSPLQAQLIDSSVFDNSSVSDLEIIPISEGTWYYGEVDDVWPWMQSDYTTFNLVDSNNNYHTFKVKSASTDSNGWNNAFMQNQIVYCLISADTTKHKINVHVDNNYEVDQVRLADMEIPSYSYVNISDDIHIDPDDIPVDIEIPDPIPDPIPVVDSLSDSNV